MSARRYNGTSVTVKIGPFGVIVSRNVHDPACAQPCVYVPPGWSVPDADVAPPNPVTL